MKKKFIFVLFIILLSFNQISYAEVKDNIIVKKQTETNYVFKKLAKGMGGVVFSSIVLYCILKIIKNVKSLKEPSNIIEKTKQNETMLSKATGMDEAVNNFIIRTKDTI